MPAQATKSEATFISVPDQRLRNVTEIQDSQNIQNIQSTIGNPLNTTHKVTEKNTPSSEHNEKNTSRSEHNLINLLQKVKTLVSKIPLLITKDTIQKQFRRSSQEINRKTREGA